VRRLSVLLAATLLASAALALWWVHAPIGVSGDAVELSVEPGSSAQDVAHAVASQTSAPAPLLYWWFRLSGQSRNIKAGNYELGTGTTPRSLLQKLVRGEQSLRSVTLLEGWTFAQMRQALRKADSLQQVTADLGAEALMERIGKPGVPAEGRFFPDTYTYSKGATDLSVLLRASHAMEKKLGQAWAQRHPDIAVSSPEQALILASIIEKETGLESDRRMVASVFHNRLRIGMRLQTDPTVIYGMGSRFDGNLRRVDLQTDTPWNTYTRAGLPPTPIAMPGKAALLAAVQPQTSNALYFVARGDGSSEFSATLDAHNRAVDRYQRGQQARAD
jgi:UPF0755 protein